MKIEKFKPFCGQHCETTATGTLIKNQGIDLSEPLLFGLGEGLSFIFWNMKIMDFPFIGGRIKQFELTKNICKNLDLELEVRETSSLRKAWENVKQSLDQNVAVGLQLDCYHLDYFTTKIHFAGHFVAMYGYDDEFAFLVDTDQQSKNEIKTTRHSLALARSEKGPMSSKNLSYTIQKKNPEFDLEKALKDAIMANAKAYLNPPIKNISYKGILKTSEEIIKWFQNSEDVKTEFQQCAMLMEGGGTGGAIFRNLYRDFLKESYALLGNEEIQNAYHDFQEIAPLWTTVSKLLHEAGRTNDIGRIHQASEILVDLSQREKIAMEKLLHI